MNRIYIYILSAVSVITLILLSAYYSNEYFDIIFLCTAFIVFGGFWWFGHKSAWGALHYAYDLPEISTMLKLTDAYENIDVLSKEERIGGVSAYPYVSEQGILFESAKFLKIMSPSVFIPWSEISNIEPDNTQGFLHIKRTKLSIKNHNIGILIPKGELTNNLFTYINENDITFGH